MNNNQTPHKLLSKDTNKALNEVATTVKKLGNVYKEEIIALEKHDSDAFMALQEKKLLVAHEYKNDMGQMLARKKEIRAASVPVKDRLKKIQTEFADLSRKNMEAIERMRRCTERLGNTIRHAAVRDAQISGGYGYGENGAIPDNAKRRAVSSGLSETV